MATHTLNGIQLKVRGSPDYVFKFVINNGTELKVRGSPDYVIKFVIKVAKSEADAGRWDVARFVLVQLNNEFLNEFTLKEVHDMCCIWARTELNTKGPSAALQVLTDLLDMIPIESELYDPLLATVGVVGAMAINCPR